ncbi:hypothetical protein CBR_g51824 [Chara braunii]|uniref:Uncharacterized protein n=1 Tax=Chara braunii TaxID=69332 RepID=A0A388M961_CHABU|nr:hypothetical protein CBR_g51824 [Chara braunii]|eukprot:GBG91090.1 hypothetical protein CBR_g51824 [Chara braunii]
MAAVSAATVATYPMETVKTLMQVQSASTAAPVSSLELFRRLRAATGVTGVYRGALWTLSGQVPSLAVRFGTYQLMTAFFQDGRLLPGVSTSEALKAGALAGALEAVVSTPLELVKVRIQSTHRQAVGCGIGLQASGLIDNATSLRPPVFRTLESTIQPGVHNAAGSMPEWLRTSFAGGVSAGLAAAVSHPLDTATRRLHATFYPKHVRMEKSILRESEPATWLQRTLGIASAHQTRRWTGIGLQVTQHSIGFFCLLAVYHAGLMAL